MSHGDDGAVANAAHRVLSYFDDRRRQIAADLDGLLEVAGQELGRIGPLGEEACRMLSTFAAGGKMIRGALVCYAASLGSAPPGALRVASAMELFQSALLIHDDIMDRDTRRRGQPSVHHQYARKAVGLGWPDAAHLGVSLGVCAGDIAFFLAFGALQQAAVPPTTAAQLLGMFAHELSLVGVAQMIDVSAGVRSEPLSKDEVLNLYLYKTGRYTFSLPLRAGALVGGLEPAQADRLDRVGETLGLLFQIKDDELGLFGDPDQTGKPLGSDIREGKKTIYHACLLRRSPPEVAQRVRRWWGASDLDDTQVRSLLDLMAHHGVRAEVEETAQALQERARQQAGTDPFLLDLLEYSRTRTR